MRYFLFSQVQYIENETTDLSIISRNYQKPVISAKKILVIERENNPACFLAANRTMAKRLF